MSAEGRLVALGLTLPSLTAPLATYVPTVRTGNLLFVSGQLPMVAGVVQWRGKLGGGVTLEQGQAAARQCLLNMLAHVRAAAGSLDNVVRVVRLGGFIAAVPEFMELPQVMNGASDLCGEIFGERGRHARSTVGVPCLPADAPVEIEGLFELA